MVIGPSRVSKAGSNGENDKNVKLFRRVSSPGVFSESTPTVGQLMTDVATLTRRETLRSTAVATGGLALGVGTLSGVAAAAPRTGGRALTFTSGFQTGVPFTVTGLAIEESIPASCHASESEMKAYQEYHIEYDDSSTSLIGVYKTKKHLETGSRFEFTSGQGCKDWPFGTVVTKSAFKPVK